MSKNIIIGLAALGGLILVATLLPDTAPDTNETDQTETVVDTTLASEVTASFPTYPDSVVANQQRTEGDDGRIFYTLSLDTKDNIKDINDWYRQALSANGWSIKSDKNVAGYQIIQAEKANLFTSMQAVNGQPAGTVRISQQAQIRP